MLTFLHWVRLMIDSISHLVSKRGTWTIVKRAEYIDTNVKVRMHLKLPMKLLF